MYLKNRFLISNFVNVLVPLAVTIITAFFYVLININFMNTVIGINDFESYIDMENKFFYIHRQVYNEYEKIFNKKTHNYLLNISKTMDMDIEIIDNDKVILSSIDLSLIDREKCIESFDEFGYSKIVKLDKGNYFVSVNKFLIKDKGNIYVILLTKNFVGEFNFKQFYIILFVVFIGTFTLINFIVTRKYNKSILLPLKNLCTATKNIKKGDLQIDVKEEGDNEIKDLSRDFELMRIKLKESISKQNKMDENRRILVSNISHDLRTPITSIKGYIEAILDGITTDKEKIEKYLKSVYDRANTIEDMLEDLFLYSKLDIHQVVFNKQKCNIVEFFEFFIMDIKSDLESKNIKISMDNRLENYRIVEIDFENFKRVIMNIIQNSCKYMDKENSEINIILRETHSDIIIEIKDNGIGIEKENLELIFERFFRADESRSKVYGTGLGLSIVEEIIKGMGGSVWARSKKGLWTSILISLRKCGN